MTDSAFESPEPTVFLVDDQPEVLEILGRMARASGFRTETYQSGRDFLAAFDAQRAGCLVLDLRMPEMTGTQLQAQLAAAGALLPIIVVTGYADLTECIEAVRQGVFDILQKPVEREELVDCIQRAVKHDRNIRRVRSAWDQLTDRERDVLPLLLDGWEMKRIAAHLGVTFGTVAKHRARVLEKFAVRNEVELVQKVLPVAERLGLPVPKLRVDIRGPHFVDSVSPPVVAAIQAGFPRKTVAPEGLLGCKRSQVETRRRSAADTASIGSSGNRHKTFSSSQPLLPQPHESPC
ncbi:MAG: response regulator transcription factor [Planctomycetes bacterium]|nr:response regulator transcription factor [Planctomycetota bacterium]